MSVRSYKLLIKTIAGLVLTAFLVQDIAWASPDPGVFQRPAPIVAAPTTTLASILKDPRLIRTPFEACLVKEIHAGTNGKLLIHMQDAHANFSGQMNLAKTLENLARAYGIRLILGEGSEGDMTLDRLKTAADERTWKIAAKRFLQDSVIVGEEYLNLTSNLPIKIIGVEDQKLYDESLLVYEKLTRNRPIVLDYLRTIRISLDRLKNRNYPKELLAYETKKKEFTDDPSKRLALLEPLTRAQAIDWKKYPQTTRLLELKKREKDFSFERLQKEEEQLFEDLYVRGQREGVDKILKALKTSAGFAQMRLWEELFWLAESGGVDLAGYPDLKDYREYLGSFVDINPERVFDEVELLEDEVYRLSLPDENQRRLKAIERFLDLLEKAYRVQMSSQEFEALLLNQKDFPAMSWQAFLNEELSKLNYFEDFIPYKEVLEEALKPIFEFYNLVDQRDEAFVQRSLKAMEEGNESAAFLITGGYHTQHLTDLIRKEDFSYVVLTPMVDQATDPSKYEKILLGPLALKHKAVRSAASTRKPGPDDTLRQEYLRSDPALAAARLAAAYPLRGPFDLNLGAVKKALADISKPPVRSPESIQGSGARMALQFGTSMRESIGAMMTEMAVRHRREELVAERESYLPLQLRARTLYHNASHDGAVDPAEFEAILTDFRAVFASWLEAHTEDSLQDKAAEWSRRYNETFFSKNHETADKPLRRALETAGAIWTEPNIFLSLAKFSNSRARLGSDLDHAKDHLRSFGVGRKSPSALDPQFDLDGLYMAIARDHGLNDLDRAFFLPSKPDLQLLAVFFPGKPSSLGARMAVSGRVSRWVEGLNQYDHSNKGGHTSRTLLSVLETDEDAFFRYLEDKYGVFKFTSVYVDPWVTADDIRELVRAGSSNYVLSEARGDGALAFKWPHLFVDEIAYLESKRNGVRKESWTLQDDTYGGSAMGYTERQVMMDVVDRDDLAGRGPFKDLWGNLRLDWALRGMLKVMLRHGFEGYVDIHGCRWGSADGAGNLVACIAFNRYSGAKRRPLTRPESAFAEYLFEVLYREWSARNRGELLDIQPQNRKFYGSKKQIGAVGLSTEKYLNRFADHVRSAGAGARMAKSEDRDKDSLPAIIPGGSKTPLNDRTSRWTSDLDVVLPIDGSTLPGFRQWVEWNGIAAHILQGELHGRFDWAVYLNDKNEAVMGLPPGTAVRAIADGRIVQISQGLGRGADGYNTFMNIEHGKSNSGLFSQYAHIIPSVSEGQNVRKGQEIAKLYADPRGDRGRLVHLDYSISHGWNEADRRRVDPTKTIYSRINFLRASPQGSKEFVISGRTEQPRPIQANYKYLNLSLPSADRADDRASEIAGALEMGRTQWIPQARAILADPDVNITPATKARLARALENHADPLSGSGARMAEASDEIAKVLNVPQEDEAVRNILGWFPDNWQEAVSMIGTNIVDPDRWPFISELVSRGFSASFISDLLNFRLYGMPDVTFETFPQSFKDFILDNAGAKRGVSRDDLSGLFVWYFVFRMDQKYDLLTEPLKTRLEEALIWLPRIEGAREMNAKLKPKWSYKRIIRAFVEEDVDPRAYQSAFVASAWRSIPESTAVKLAHMPDARFADIWEICLTDAYHDGTRQFNLVLKDPAIIRRLSGIPEWAFVDGKLFAATVNYRTKEGGSVEVLFVQPFLLFSDRFKRPEEISVPLDRLVLNLFEAYLDESHLTNTIFARTGSSLFVGQAVAMHRTAIERINNLFRLGGYKLDSIDVWKKELTESPIAKAGSDAKGARMASEVEVRGLLEKLGDPNSDTRALAFNDLSNFHDKSGFDASNFAYTLQRMESRSNAVCSAMLSALPLFISADKGFASPENLRLVLEKLFVGNGKVHASAFAAAAAFKVDPNAFTSDTLRWLIESICDEETGVRGPAIKVLPIFLRANKSAFTHGYLEYLIQKSSVSDPAVRSAAIRAMQVFIKADRSYAASAFEAVKARLDDGAVRYETFGTIPILFEADPGLADIATFNLILDRADNTYDTKQDISRALLAFPLANDEFKQDKYLLMAARNLEVQGETFGTERDLRREWGIAEQSPPLQALEADHPDILADLGISAADQDIAPLESTKEAALNAIRAHTALYRRLAGSDSLGIAAVKKVFEEDPLALDAVIQVAGKHSLEFEELFSEERLGLSALREVFLSEPRNLSRALSGFFGWPQPSTALQIYDQLVAKGIDRGKLRKYFVASPHNFMLALQMLSEPNAAMSSSEFDFTKESLKALLEQHGWFLAFRVVENTAVNSAKRLARNFSIPLDRVRIQISPAAGPEVPGLARADFDNVRGAGSFHFARDEIGIEFGDFDDVSQDALTIHLPYEFFKYDLNGRPDPNVAAWKTAMGIGDRPVWVVASPSPAEIRQVLEAASREVERPLVILGVRRESLGLKEQLLADYPGYVVLNRTDGDKQASAGFNGLAEGQRMGEADIVVLNTQNELAPLFAAADVSIVGEGRNPIEPLVQGKPVYYFPNRRFNSNQAALAIIKKFDAGEEITDLAAQVKAGKRRSDRDQNAAKALQYFRDQFQEANEFFTIAVIGSQISAARMANRVRRVREDEPLVIGRSMTLVLDGPNKNEQKVTIRFTGIKKSDTGIRKPVLTITSPDELPIVKDESKPWAAIFFVGEQASYRRIQAKMDPDGQTAVLALGGDFSIEIDGADIAPQPQEAKDGLSGANIAIRMQLPNGAVFVDRDQIVHTYLSLGASVADKEFFFKNAKNARLSSRDGGLWITPTQSSFFAVIKDVDADQIRFVADPKSDAVIDGTLTGKLTKKGDDYTLILPEKYMILETPTDRLPQKLVSRFSVSAVLLTRVGKGRRLYKLSGGGDSVTRKLMPNFRLVTVRRVDRPILRIMPVGDKDRALLAAFRTKMDLPTSSLPPTEANAKGAQMADIKTAPALNAPPKTISRRMDCAPFVGARLVSLPVLRSVGARYAVPTDGLSNMPTATPTQQHLPKTAVSTGPLLIEEQEVAVIQALENSGAIDKLAGKRFILPLSEVLYAEMSACMKNIIPKLKSMGIDLTVMPLAEYQNKQDGSLVIHLVDVDHVAEAIEGASVLAVSSRDKAAGYSFPQFLSVLVLMGLAATRGKPGDFISGYETAANLLGISEINGEEVSALQEYDPNNRPILLNRAIDRVYPTVQMALAAARMAIKSALTSA